MMPAVHVPSTNHLHPHHLLHLCVMMIRLGLLIRVRGMVVRNYWNAINYVMCSRMIGPVMAMTLIQRAACAVVEYVALAIFHVM